MTTDLVGRLRKRQMMRDVRGTGDRFNKQIAVPDPWCQQAADEIERLTHALAEKDAEIERLRADAERYRCECCNKSCAPGYCYCAELANRNGKAHADRVCREAEKRADLAATKGNNDD